MKRCHTWIDDPNKGRCVKSEDHTGFCQYDWKLTDRGEMWTREACEERKREWEEMQKG